MSSRKASIVVHNNNKINPKLKHILLRLFALGIWPSFQSTNFTLCIISYKMILPQSVSNIYYISTNTLIKNLHGNAIRVLQIGLTHCLGRQNT